MSDSIENVEIDEAVAAATSEDSFDALAFFSNASLPEDSVTVYANSAAAYKLKEIKEKYDAQKTQADEEGLGITDEVFYADEDEIDALKNELKNSAVIFKLRGLAPAAREAIEKSVRASSPYTEGAANTEYNEKLNATLIANTIVSVSNAAGKVDSRKFDVARAAAFIKVVPESEFAKLYYGVLKVNYIGDAIDQAVNADFS